MFGDSVTYDNVTHEYSLVSSVLYTASLNDTNSSLSCNVQQDDLYSSVQTVTIIVDPKPLPLIKVNNAVLCCGYLKMWSKTLLGHTSCIVGLILQCCNSNNPKL